MVEGGELSYEELLDHILNNKPIPNIVEVANTTLDENLATSSSLKPRVRPWEGHQQHQPHQQLQDPRADISLSIDQESLEGINSLSKLSEYYDIQSKLQMNDGGYNSNDDNNDGNNSDNDTATVKRIVK
ncbi:hypothetical protein SMKI_10G2140 [Saccharomyces mikatae IFO 1815]|uniref:Peroxisomal membrane protein PEX14-like KPWE domain-containing protein n=1 Tax=Saccharomyces mikatae IFO 1815 TaxID=226126 RepID=A0AA35NDD1_SACMI|nr:uncharacterized protein SMKI_10G2140 [Saccharomyces mikatae IFO 1815]CAI4034423.1 hypothetical protein SMKI_10G2140 [Saccharomyces mikatae IFO 1815]